VSDDHLLQLTLFDDREKVYRREKVIDGIKNRYGSDAILNASSLLTAGVARERAGQIGGHYK
jgi:DNA polymerase-4